MDETMKAAPGSAGTGLVPALEQTNRVAVRTSPPGAVLRSVPPSPFIDEFERLEAGWGAHLLPAPVTWVLLDAERPMGDAGGSYIGWREDSDGYRLVERDKGADPLPWILDHVRPSLRREIMHLLRLWYPGRDGRPCGMVPAPVWRTFLRLAAEQVDRGIWRLPGQVGPVQWDEYLDRFCRPRSSQVQASFLEVRTGGQYAALLMDALRIDAEELRRRQAADCGKATMVGLYRTKEGDGWSAPKADLRRWRCRSWTCPHCSRHMQRQKARKLASALEAYSETHLDRPLFLTLTIDPGALRRRYPMLSDAHREVLSWKLVRAQWKRFVRLARKRWGPEDGGPAEMHYSLRIEGHKSGYAHLHAVIICRRWNAAVRNDLRSGKTRRNWPTKRWLEATAQDCGYGRICDLQVVKDLKKAAWYLQKAGALGEAGRNLCAISGELTKASQVRSQRIPRGFRTLETSRGFYFEAEARGMRPPPEQEEERVYSSVGMVGLDLDEIAEMRNVRPQDFFHVLDWTKPYQEGDPPTIAEGCTEDLSEAPGVVIDDYG